MSEAEVETRELEIGNLVECINPKTPHLIKGKQYTVKEITKRGNVKVTDGEGKDVEGTYYQNRLKLVEEDWQDKLKELFN